MNTEESSRKDAETQRVEEGYFKLRADCITDWVAALERLSRNGLTEYCLTDRVPCAGPEITFRAIGMSLEQVRAILLEIPDGHVMAETVNHSLLYTGERSYGTAVAQAMGAIAAFPLVMAAAQEAEALYKAKSGYSVAQMQAALKTYRKLWRRLSPQDRKSHLDAMRCWSPEDYEVMKKEMQMPNQS